MANEDIMDLNDEPPSREYIREIERVLLPSPKIRPPNWPTAHTMSTFQQTPPLPRKAVIATHAIADTVLTYLMAALGGRNPMFNSKA